MSQGEESKEVYRQAYEACQRRQFSIERGTLTYLVIYYPLAQYGQQALVLPLALSLGDWYAIRSLLRRGRAAIVDRLDFELIGLFGVVSNGLCTAIKLSVLRIVFLVVIHLVEAARGSIALNLKRNCIVRWCRFSRRHHDAVYFN